MAREGVDFEVGDEAGWSEEGAGDGTWDTLEADGLGAEEDIDAEECGDDDLVPMVVAAAWTAAGFVGQTHTGVPWKSRPWSNLLPVGRVRSENVERDDGGRHKQVAVHENDGDDGDERGDGGRSWGLVGEVVGMDVEDPYTVETVEEDHAEED